MRSLLTLAALATLMAGALPAYAASSSCANFKALDNGTELAEKFKIKGFRFKDRTGGVSPVVHDVTDTQGEVRRGINFDPRGLVITFPESHADDVTAQVRLRVAQGETVRLRAYNGQGVLVASALATNEVWDFVVAQAPASERIASVTLDGGGGLSTVAEICGTP